MTGHTPDTGDRVPTPPEPQVCLECGELARRNPDTNIWFHINPRLTHRVRRGRAMGPG